VKLYEASEIEARVIALEQRFAAEEVSRNGRH
jgi:hypothetical protein